MSLSDALFFAAVVAAVYALFVGPRTLDLDFLFSKSKNRKQAKMERLLAQRNTPLQDAGIRRDMRKAFERVLCPLEKGSKSLLPPRMDMAFRRRMERQLDLLEQRQLCRDIRMTDVVPLPKNDFRRWTDDGREWREAILQCSVLERLIRETDKKTVYEIYRKNAYVRLLQSRHIRTSDRQEERKSYYARQAKVICPSCGAQVELGGQQTLCPYCGGVLESEFYDWQTENFEIYEQMSNPVQRILQLVLSTAVLFVSMFLCLYLIEDTQISFTAGVGAAVSVWLAVFAVFGVKRLRQKQLANQIVNYSENYLRSCLHEALYNQKNSDDLLDYTVDEIVLKSVVNTDKTTTIMAQVCVSETYLPKGKKPVVKNSKRLLTMQRARYPEQRKADGAFFTERDCPSCGANFVPDKNHCCAFCGYGLQADNAKWVQLSEKE